jgi:hypothetical protein
VNFAIATTYVSRASITIETRVSSHLDSPGLDDTPPLRKKPAPVPTLSEADQFGEHGMVARPADAFDCWRAAGNCRDGLLMVLHMIRTLSGCGRYPGYSSN